MIRPSRSDNCCFGPQKEWLGESGYSMPSFVDVTGDNKADYIVYNDDIVMV